MTYQKTTIGSMMLTVLAAALLLGGCVGEANMNPGLDSRSGSLAGDQCDDVLMMLSQANDQDRDALREDYRQCVEEAIRQNGGHAACRENDDAACDELLAEIQQAAQGQDRPDCADASSDADRHVCELMDQYEACQLDHSGDQNGDAESGESSDGENHDGDAESGESQESSDHDGDAESGESADTTEHDGDTTDSGDGEAGETTDGSGDTAHDDVTCDEIRARAENAGSEDRDFYHREYPDCFDQTTESGETTDGGDQATDGGGGTESSDGI